MKRIDTLGQWRILEASLIEKGYELYQMQYGCECPEGSIFRFRKNDKKDAEYNTFNKNVHKSMINFEAKKR